VNQAYEDTSLPIGLGQTISKPGVVARMAELLRHGVTGPLGRVLEIGTGCGYQAAVLSQLATEVYSIERLRGLHEKARVNLRHLRLAKLHLMFGDGMLCYHRPGSINLLSAVELWHLCTTGRQQPGNRPCW
jgi:protein-L-isoaspartate(D-aspartate) O-methyltransferase